MFHRVKSNWELDSYRIDPGWPPQGIRNRARGGKAKREGGRRKDGEEESLIEKRLSSLGRKVSAFAT